MGDSLDAIFAQARRDAMASRRRARRQSAVVYRRDLAMIMEWGGAASRAAAGPAMQRPDDSSTTRALCRALYRDLQTARQLPRHATTRFLKLGALRRLFTCECALYLRQRHAATPPALTTGQWLDDFCRRIAG